VKKKSSGTKKATIGVVAAGAVAAAIFYFLGKKPSPPPPPPPPDKANLWGIVTDSQSSAVLSGREVSCDSYSAVTDTNGRYEILSIEPGTYGIIFTDPLGNYETLTL